MNDGDVILGQLSLWDIEIPKKEQKILNEEVISRFDNKSNLEITSEQQEFINKNNIMQNDNLTGVVLSCGGGLRIELQEGLEYKTLYINREGKQEFIINRKVNPTPMCKIIYFTEDIGLNDIQNEKLEEFKGKVDRIIKRKGDANVILIHKEGVISINPKGWILEWANIQAVYEESDIVILDEEIEGDADTWEITVGDTVEVEYLGIKYKGQVVRRYGPKGGTVNVKFDGKHTAFYIGAVKKIA